MGISDILNEHSKSEELLKNEVAPAIFFLDVVLKILGTGSRKRFCTFLKTELLKPRKGRVYIISSSVSSLIGKWLLVILSSGTDPLSVGSAFP